MGRVETRIYRQKQRKAKWRRWLLGIAAVMVLVVLLWRGGQAAFVTDYIGLPGPTPLESAFDRTVETREVTLNAETWYAIQTGVFSTQEAAVQKADAYTQRGAPGTVVRQGEKWRVFIACYGTEEEAAAVRTRLESNQKVDTYLYAWECPEVRLRLSGMAGQLDAAEAGFTLLTTTAATLRDTAMELDAAQLTNQEVMASARALDDQIALWEDTVRSRFGKSAPALVEGMMTITGGWDARYAALTAAQDATALSAALKAQAMGMFDDICTWRTALKEQ